MSALFSFLASSAFRLLWGEVSHFVTVRQEQKNEIERMKTQGVLEAAQHGRNMESIKIQADLGVKTIQAQSDADQDRIAMAAWAGAVADVGKKTGIPFIDIWNGSIRPALATLALSMVVFQFAQNSFVMSDWDREIVGGILGIYLADRQLSKRGK